VDKVKCINNEKVGSCKISNKYKRIIFTNFFAINNDQVVVCNNYKFRKKTKFSLIPENSSWIDKRGT